ncbi:hypothetical protein BOTU111921_11385 [Bordetella tumbae]|uniref:hypothetical protein n=1 Tax=Bordetella tumbae TaxID=1649139 RepID=UPI0039EE537B
MSLEYQFELMRAGQEMREKFAYFLLAAVGAGVGFGVTQTREALLTVRLIPAFVALALWGVSFYCGCRYLHKSSVMKLTNAKMIGIYSGTDPHCGRDPERQRIAAGVLQDDFDKNNSVAASLYRWQLHMFLAGCGSFIIWHSWEIAFRSGIDLSIQSIMARLGLL